LKFENRRDDGKLTCKIISHNFHWKFWPKRKCGRRCRRD